jgi:hypothetical protein
MRLVEKLPAVTKRRVLLILCAAMVAAVIAVFYQSALIGWWRGEAKYKGRYTNSWRAELRSYDSIAIGDLGCVDWIFVRRTSRLEDWLAKVMPGSSPKVHPPAPLQDGDPEAIPVLVELLTSPERIVRIMAAAGLEQIGSPAQEAIPALSALVDDEAGDVVFAARQAIRIIQYKIVHKEE